MPDHPARRRHSRVLTRPLTPAARTRAQTGFAAGTAILTLDGEMPVEHLGAGDRIVTRSGARVLLGLSASVVDDAVTIRPQTLGHDRPATETTVGPLQEILVRDWRARALYGSDQASVPAARLTDGEYIRQAPAPVRVFRLIFAQDEVIYAGGIEAPVAGGT